MVETARQKRLRSGDPEHVMRWHARMQAAPKSPKSTSPRPGPLRAAGSLQTALTAGHHTPPERRARCRASPAQHMELLSRLQRTLKAIPYTAWAARALSCKTPHRLANARVVRRNPTPPGRRAHCRAEPYTAWAARALSRFASSTRTSWGSVLFTPAPLWPGAPPAWDMRAASPSRSRGRYTAANAWLRGRSLPSASSKWPCRSHTMHIFEIPSCARCHRGAIADTPWMNMASQRYLVSLIWCQAWRITVDTTHPMQILSRRGAGMPDGLQEYHTRRGEGMRTMEDNLAPVTAPQGFDSSGRPSRRAHRG